MFISQTRLVQTTVEPPVDRARFAGMVRDVAEAMSYIPPAQRPAEDQWGAYELVYDLRCSVVLNPIGVRDDATRHLIVLYDVWPTNASRQAGDPPALRNSHELGLRPGQTQAALRAEVIRHAEDYLIRASLNGYGGDQRDPRHTRLATEGDPTGEYDKIRDLKDVVRNVNTAASNPSSAPLVTMVPK